MIVAKPPVVVEQPATRAQALAAGLALMDEIAPRTNSRGYSDGCIQPAERIRLALQIADWLLAGGDVQAGKSLWEHAL